MQIVVCVKQIPDPASPSSLDPETKRLVRPPEQVLDDTDRYGIEVGLQLGEETGGTVTLLSMGPAGTMQGIRQALAMGADKAVIVDDPALEGSDALTTAKVLAAAARREGFDVLVAGVESTDGYTGIVPQMMAELLDAPALTFARKVELDGGRPPHRAPDRLGIRCGGVRPARGAGRNGGGGGAPLPDLPGHHGGQETNRSKRCRRPTWERAGTPARRWSPWRPPPNGRRGWWWMTTEQATCGSSSSSKQQR